MLANIAPISVVDRPALITFSEGTWWLLAHLPQVEEWCQTNIASTPFVIPGKYILAGPWAAA